MVHSAGREGAVLVMLCMQWLEGGREGEPV